MKQPLLELPSQQFAGSYHVEWPNRNIYVSLNGWGSQNLDARALQRAVRQLKHHCWMRPWLWLQFRLACSRFGERKP